MGALMDMAMEIWDPLKLRKSTTGGLSKKGQLYGVN
jgi:hypothetical protein